MKSLPKSKAAAKKPQKKPAERSATMPLGASNYIMIALGVVVIAASYLGMYLEKAVDGFFSLYISPVTLTGAYAWIMYAVLYRSKGQN